MRKKDFWNISLLGGYGFLLLYLTISGNISKYINVKLIFLTVFSLIIIIMLFVNAIRKAINQHCYESMTYSCESSFHRHIYWVCLIPVILGLFVPAAIIGQNSQGISEVRIKTQDKSSLKTKSDLLLSVTQLDIGNILFGGNEKDKEQLTRSKVKLEGAALSHQSLANNEIVVYRMLISCCAADAVPLGVLVRLPPGIKVKAGEWVEVEGQISILDFDEKYKAIPQITSMVTLDFKFAVMEAQKVNVSTNPGQFYLY